VPVDDLPYLSHARYLRGRYGRPVYRVSVDGGFSCPNRADRCSPGCAYCAEDGARAPYLGGAGSLEEQVTRGIRFLKNRYGADSFLLYFQAFSGTNAPVERLRSVYDSALALAPFLELVVSTRPDCVDEGKADLLGSYRSRGLDVWVELGLQSANDLTLARINRGHTVADFTRAHRLLRERGIKVAVHLIFGLPGEGAREADASSRFVADLDPDGVKIHNLQILRGSPLAKDFLKGELSAPGPEWHLERVIRALSLLPRRTVIMRVTCDTPPGRLISPRGFWDKGTFRRRLAAEMRRRGDRQGLLREAEAGGAGLALTVNPPVV
jgi:radical SAM protein (TIGR01212 family)